MRNRSTLRTTGLAIALGLSMTLPGAWAAEDRAADRLYVIDPEVPMTLSLEVRQNFLQELATGFQAIHGCRKASHSWTTGTLMVLAAPEAEPRLREFMKELRTRLLVDPEAAAQRIRGDDRSKEEQRTGREVLLEVLIVVADREGKGSSGVVPPSLEARLGELFGFHRFELVGSAVAAGVVGDASSLTTTIPWKGKSRLGLEFKFNTGVTSQGDPLVQAEFGVHEQSDVAPEGNPIHTEISTTYSPRKGLPTVVGASPLSSSRSLVFLVNHSGPGVE